MMAYPNFYGGYQYYQPPMPDQLAQLRQQQFQPQPQIQQPASNGIIWVQGEEGAKAYMVAAGNSVLLMDSENSAFYIKSTDASGMPMPLRVFDYTERTGTEKVTQTVQESSVQFATKEELAALAARLDALTAQKQTDKEDESNA